MFIKEDDLKLNDWQFSQRKCLPWEAKLKLTETRIKEWYENWNGDVYVSYSGGLDSTVLLDLVRKCVGDDVPAVFSNTGLEFPEIVRFARQISPSAASLTVRPYKSSRVNKVWVGRMNNIQACAREIADKEIIYR